MKLKSLLYGTAAVLVSTGATNVALAADLPVAAAPVEYVRICDAYGSGFFYIPGKDTCLKISGRVRISSFFVEDADVDPENTDNWKTYARAEIKFDARNETDFGLLRSFLSLRSTHGSGTINVSNDDLDYELGLSLDEAFISLSTDGGQLTIGKTGTFFAFGLSGTTFNGPGTFDPADDATLYAYTFNLGNGLSATLALEDAYTDGRKAGGDPLLVGDDIYGGQDLLDIVANIRVDQGWGSAQISGALRNIETKAGAVTTFGTFTTTDDEWGWAVNAGVELTIPGAPIDLTLAGCYTEGMVLFCIDGGAVAGGEWDADIIGASGLSLTEAWSVVGGATFKIPGSDFSISIDGVYAEIDAANAVGSLLGDKEFHGISGNVIWKGISGLALGLNVDYRETDFADPALSDVDVWGVEARADRTF